MLLHCNCNDDHWTNHNCLLHFSFDVDIGAIIEDFETNNPDVLTQCTEDGDDEPDEGCLFDCFFGGEEACQEFTDTVTTIIADTATEDIVFPPEPEITLQGMFQLASVCLFLLSSSSFH